MLIPVRSGSPMRAMIGEDSREAGTIAEFWLKVSLCERDFDGVFAR